MSFVRGDLGKSIVTGRPVSNDIFTRLGAQSTLAGIAALFGVIGGILVGMFLAQRKGTTTDFRMRHDPSRSRRLCLNS